MGCLSFFSINRLIFVALLSMLALTLGCQTGPGISQSRLLEHRALVDFSGLKDAQQIPTIKSTVAAPQTWIALSLQKGPMYAHQQWRSPSRATGVGVAHISLPFPLSVDTLLWFAKAEYTRQQSGEGKVLGQWTDSLGREWFEAENRRYHIRGYAVVSSADAWIVYSGYRVTVPLNPTELALADRCLETVIPETKH